MSIVPSWNTSQPAHEARKCTTFRAMNAVGSCADHADADDADDAAHEERRAAQLITACVRRRVPARPKYGVRDWFAVINDALAEQDALPLALANSKGLAHIVVVPHDSMCLDSCALNCTGCTARGRLVGVFVRALQKQEGTVVCKSYRALLHDLRRNHASDRRSHDRDRISEIDRCKLLVLMDQYKTGTFSDSAANTAALVLDDWLHVFGAGRHPPLNVLVFCRRLMPVSEMPTRQWMFEWHETDHITPIRHGLRVDAHAVQPDIGCGVCLGAGACCMHDRPPWQSVIENLIVEQSPVRQGPDIVFIRGIRRGFGVHEWLEGLLLNNIDAVVVYKDVDEAKADVFNTSIVRARFLENVKLFVFLFPLQKNRRQALDVHRQINFLLHQLTAHSKNPAAQFIVFSRDQNKIPALLSSVVFDFVRDTRQMSAGSFIQYVKISDNMYGMSQPRNTVPLPGDYDDSEPFGEHHVEHQTLVGNHWETNHDLVTDSDSGDEHAGMLLSDVQSDASSMEGDVESDDFLT